MGKTTKYPCENCGTPISLNRDGLCKSCRVKPCSRCKKPFLGNNSLSKYCAKCHFVKYNVGRDAVINGVQL